MQHITYRGGLSRTKKAIEDGEIAIGFLGGSITDSRPMDKWSDEIVYWLAGEYPAVKIRVENAAIGATGSILGSFLVQPAIIDKKCDLVFIEYAVNDIDEPRDLRRQTREGILRQLLQNGIDVVIVYTYSQAMYCAMLAEEVPDTIGEFEALAEHYQISSVWMGLYAFRKVLAGQLRWDSWLPDGLHPGGRGSQIYAESVSHLLRYALAQEDVSYREVPEPLDILCWEKTRWLPWKQTNWTSPWILRRWHISLTATDFPYILDTTAPGAPLAFSFDGTGLVLAFDFGQVAADFRYRIDGDDTWQEVYWEHFPWVGKRGWLRTYVAARNLPKGEHHIEFETMFPRHQTENTSTDCHLALVGVIE